MRTSKSPLLEVEDLRVWYPLRHGIFSRIRGHARAVDGICFQLAPGETLGLVGESGCGKSTLARAILRLEDLAGGRILFEGQDLAGLEGRELRRMRRHLQVVFQDPFASLNPRLSVLEILTEAPVYHGLIARAQRAVYAETLLREVGLDASALDRYPHEFSGGQRQRLCIARALALKPRLLICDEAVSALDVSVQAQVINLLSDLQAQHGFAYVFIAHDLSVVRHLAHHTAVMYLGRFVEMGPTAAVIDNPLHPYTRALISAVPRLDKASGRRIILEGDVPSPARPPVGCRFHPRCPYAADRCRQMEPSLDPVPDEPARRVACLRLAEMPLR